jgi:hypothetical protein
MRLFLWPGDFVANLAGLPKGSDNRLIFRMYVNVVFWGAVCTLILVLLLT